MDLLAFMERHPWWSTWWLLVGAGCFALVLIVVDSMWANHCNVRVQVEQAAHRRGQGSRSDLGAACA